MAISLSNLGILEELFTTKNWEIVKDLALFSSTFNRFCSRLDLFESEKQELMIELGYEFLNLSINDFQPYFIDAINKIDNLETYKSVIIAPLKKPSLQQTKSADAVWYYLKNYSDFSYETFGPKLYFASDWRKISLGIANPNVILILIDDFIGTGETVVETMHELYGDGYIDDSHTVMVLALAAQTFGVKAINDVYKGILTFGIELKKGLSDNYSDQNLSNKKKLMEEMEQKLKVFPEYAFGYGQSESLFAVSGRSANNTFPIFWLEKGKQLAPFKR